MLQSYSGGTTITNGAIAVMSLAKYQTLDDSKNSTLY